MANLIKTLPLADLPYSDRLLRYGGTAAENNYSRDYALRVLRGKTNLLRLAYDYNDSYASAPEKSVSHYRDYLTAEAVLNSLRSSIYTDDRNTIFNTRAERVLASLPEEKRWVYKSLRDQRETSPKYSGSLGTPAYYFNIANIDDYPLPSLQRLAGAVWSINGVDPKLSISDRLGTLYRYLDLPDNLQARLSEALRAIEVGPLPEDDARKPIQIQARRYFVTTEDMRNIEQKILFGTYSPPVVDVAYQLLDERQQQQFARSLRYANTMAIPGGINLLLQTLVMEGYARAAAVIDTLPPEVVYGKLTDFLYRNSDYREEKYEIGANLNMIANAFNLLDSSGLRTDAKQLGARAYNNSMYWLESSGDRQGVSPDGWHSVYPFLKQYFPSLLSTYLESAPDSSVYPHTAFHEALQGRPAKNTSTVLSPNKTQGYNIVFNTTAAAAPVDPLFLSTSPTGFVGPLQIDPLFLAGGDTPQIGPFLDPRVGNIPSETTLALIIPDPPNPPQEPDVLQGVPQVTAGATSTVAEGGENLSAYVAYEGIGNTLTYSEYEQLESASNVVVVQTGLPAYDLSPQINNYVEQQSRSYETVNTLYIAPTPRGILGYEEMTRGMVSHLFRDSQSDEYVAAVKVDGAREEHTARIGGLLQQLQTTHLDSEIKVLKKWSNAVDSII